MRESLRVHLPLADEVGHFQHIRNVRNGAEELLSIGQVRVRELDLIRELVVVCFERTCLMQLCGVNVHSLYPCSSTYEFVVEKREDWTTSFVLLLWCQMI